METRHQEQADKLAKLENAMAEMLQVQQHHGERMTKQDQAIHVHEQQLQVGAQHVQQIRTGLALVAGQTALNSVAIQREQNRWILIFYVKYCNMQAISDAWEAATEISKIRHDWVTAKVSAARAIRDQGEEVSDSDVEEVPRRYRRLGPSGPY